MGSKAALCLNPTIALNQNLDSMCYNVSTALTLSISCRGIVALYCSGIITDGIKVQNLNICDMLCTKSHVYVDKVTKGCVLNHIHMLPRLLRNMYVLSSFVGSYLWCDIMSVLISHRLVQVIPDVQFAQHWHIYNHSQ